MSKRNNSFLKSLDLTKKEELRRAHGSREGGVQSRFQIFPSHREERDPLVCTERGVQVLSNKTHGWRENPREKGVLESECMKERDVRRENV